jgi:hypothetical protein
VFGVRVLLGAAPASASGWTSVDIGDVGLSGSATEASGVWTVQGAGGDIWGTADAFHFLYRNSGSDDRHLIVRVDDLQNTNVFSKAGLMVRASLGPGAPAVILNAKPSGEIEFMARPTAGGEMVYIAGAFVTTPAWLQLTWLQPGSAPVVSVSGAMEVILDAKPSGEVEFMARLCTGCDTTYLGGANITFPAYLQLTREIDGSTFTARLGSDAAYLSTVGSVQVPMSNDAQVGFAVTSHDLNQIARAVFDNPAR